MGAGDIPELENTPSPPKSPKRQVIYKQARHPHLPHHFDTHVGEGKNAMASVRHGYRYQGTGYYHRCAAPKWWFLTPSPLN
jgi:hypothetical protein